MRALHSSAQLVDYCAANEWAFIGSQLSPSLTLTRTLTRRRHHHLDAPIHGHHPTAQKKKKKKERDGPAENDGLFRTHTVLEKRRESKGEKIVYTPSNMVRTRIKAKRDLKGKIEGK